MTRHRRIAATLMVLGLVVSAVPLALAARAHTSTVFSGAKVNGGTVTHTGQGGHQVLMLSDDFRVPDTPAPHWQVVDSKGNTYLLQRLSIKNDGYNRTITLPAYVQDVAKVQIWCAWAETLLGEATFDPPVR